MKLHTDQRGFKGVELGMGLLLMGLLAALAIPLMSKVSDRVTDVAAAVEGRSAAVVAVSEGALEPGEVQVAGAQLIRAADGATCRWTVSSSGAVFGVWESGATSLYGRFDSQPQDCPTALDAKAAGFGPNFVTP